MKKKTPAITIYLVQVRKFRGGRDYWYKDLIDYIFPVIESDKKHYITLRGNSHSMFGLGFAIAQGNTGCGLLKKSHVGMVGEVQTTRVKTEKRKK